MINVASATSSKPVFVIMMGMGGAGKSTVAKQKFTGMDCLDCDAIKAEHPDYDPKKPELVHDWSSTEFERRRFAMLGQGRSFVADSTGKNVEKMAKWMADAHIAGYDVHICYVRVKLATALERNSKRSRTVPAEVIVEAAGMVENTFKIIATMAETSEIVNND